MEQNERRINRRYRNMKTEIKKIFEIIIIRSIQITKYNFEKFSTKFMAWTSSAGQRNLLKKASQFLQVGAKKRAFLNLFQDRGCDPIERFNFRDEIIRTRK